MQARAKWLVMNKRCAVSPKVPCPLLACHDTAVAHCTALVMLHLSHLAVVFCINILPLRVASQRKYFCQTYDQMKVGTEELMDKAATRLAGLLG